MRRFPAIKLIVIKSSLLLVKSRKLTNKLINIFKQKYLPKIIHTLKTDRRVLLVVPILIVLFVARTFWLTRPVAFVNTVKITRADYNQKLNSKKSFYKWDQKVQQVPTPVPLEPLEKISMNELIEEELKRQYSGNSQVTVTDEEVNERYIQAYKSFGTERQYLRKINEIYKINKKQLLQKIKDEMIEEKLSTEKETYLHGFEQFRNDSKIEILK